MSLFRLLSGHTVCKCGHNINDHDINDQVEMSVDSSEKWDPTWHTDIKSTDAFGEIEFLGYGQRIGKVTFSYL